MMRGPVRTEIEISFKFIVDGVGGIAASDVSTLDKCLALVDAVRQRQGGAIVASDPKILPASVSVNGNGQLAGGRYATQRCPHCQREVQGAQALSQHLSCCTGVRRPVTDGRLAGHECDRCRKVIHGGGPFALHRRKCTVPA